MSGSCRSALLRRRLARIQLYEETISVDDSARGLRSRLPANAVHDLGLRLSDGRTTLGLAGDGTGHLRSLLGRLDINTDSQVLVFSKTSLQRRQISPRRPRAIYFNDDVALAFVPGSDRIELAAVDPGLGVAFYELDATRGRSPRLQRSDGCLRCHYGPATLGVPGLYVGSVFPKPSGEPNFGLGTVVTDHRTPLAERWGGWYVTGTHGAEAHRGNAVARDPSRPDRLDAAGARNLTDLARKTDMSRYLERGSDIVALMTLEHQTQMTNHLTRLAWLARIVADAGAAGSADAGGRPGARLDDWIEATVAYMLFAGEAALAAPIAGVSTFTATFPRRGPRDARGRSLRDFDLQARLFRYPLSYLIYSRAFDGLPDGVRERVYGRLHEILTGADRSPRFRHLDEADRRAILEIVAETKTDLPLFWFPAGRPGAAAGASVVVGDSEVHHRVDVGVEDRRPRGERNAEEQGQRQQQCNRSAVHAVGDRDIEDLDAEVHRQAGHDRDVGGGGGGAFPVEADGDGRDERCGERSPAEGAEQRHQVLPRVEGEERRPNRNHDGRDARRQELVPQ